MLRMVPFRPFLLALENGEPIVIEHPENIAFDPPTKRSKGSLDFYVIAGDVRVFSTFDSVTNVSTLNAL